MTKTAVDYTVAKDKMKLEKALSDLDRAIKWKEAGIKEDQLLEAVRHNKWQELFDEKKLDYAANEATVKYFLQAINPLNSAAIAAINDESWHSKLTYAYNQATNLPFTEKAGNPHNLLDSRFKLESHSGSPAYFRPHVAINSGLVSVKYIPTIGTAHQQVESSELQNNVRLLWTPVRQSNSGAVNSYDQSDLFQFTMASSSVFEVLRLIARPINYINAKRKENNVFTAWDKHLLTLMTGSVTNANYLINFKTDIVQSLNSMIRAYNAQALPIGFDLTRRRSLLNGRIFCHDGNRDEIYVFSPTCYYVYDESNAKLVSKQLDLNFLFSSVDNMKSVLTEMLSPLVNGTVTSIMAGDMKKAFPKQVKVIRELSYECKGDVYSSDEHILEALRNADINTWILGYGADLDIKQGINGVLDTYIYQGKLDVNGYAYLDSGIRTNSDLNLLLTTAQSSAGSFADTYTCKTLLDVKKDVPERYDIMAGTRFKTSYELTIDVDANGAYTRAIKLTQWGSEIIQNVTAHTFEDNSEFTMNTMHGTWINIQAGQSFIDRDQFVEFARYYDRFHYLPQNYNLMLLRDQSAYGAFVNLMHGLYNYRPMSEQEIGYLHTASFGSLVSILATPTEELE